MIEINKNISQLKPSATLLINEKVKDLRKNGETIYHFGFGQSPFPIPNKIVKKLKKHADCNHYLPTLGLPDLRIQIASFLKKYQNIQSKGEFIFIAPGSKKLLYQSIIIINGTYLIPKGSWVSYLPQIKAASKESVVLDTFYQDNYKLTPKVLETYCKNNPSQNKLLILNTPNNPTGAVYTPEELEELAIVCRNHDIIVLSDEIYSQVTFKEKFATSISNYYPENTIIFGGLSKVFSAGGYRLGYMVLPENLKVLNSCFRSLFSETFSAVSAPIQYAAIEAYNYKKSVKHSVEASVKILHAIGKFVYNELSQVGIKCTQPQGGFYMLIDFGPFKEKLYKKQLTTGIELADYLLIEYKIALLPGVDFYFDPEEFIFRLAYVDFNGKKALKKVLKNDVPLDSEFIERFAPNVNKGIQRIVEFVKSLK